MACNQCGHKKCNCEVGPTGPAGPTGPMGSPGQPGEPPAHEWSGTSIRFKDQDSLSGKVVAVGPVTTQLENANGDHLNIPNSSLMSGIVESKSIEKPANQVQ